MIWAERITTAAAILGGMVSVPLAAQALLMPTLLAWEAEVAAAFLRGLPV